MTELLSIEIPEFNPANINDILFNCKNINISFETSIFQGQTKDNLEYLNEKLIGFEELIDEIYEYVDNKDIIESAEVNSSMDSNEKSDSVVIDLAEKYYLQLAELRSNIEKHSDLIDSSLKSMAESFKNEGNEYFRSGNYAEALEMYNKAIEIDSSDPVYFTNSSLTLQKLERWDESISNALMSIQLDDNCLKGYILLIKSYLGNNDLLKATSTLSSIPDEYESQHDVIELKQSVSLKCKDIGNSHFKEGNYNDALSFYNLSLEFDEFNYILYSNRSACYQSLKMYEQAKVDAREVIELNDMFPKGYLHLIKCHIQLNELDLAQSALSDAIEVLSELSDWFKCAPQFDELAIKIKQVKSQQENGIIKDKERAEAFKARGNQFYKDGEYQQAIVHYSQAISALPNEGLYYGNRAAAWMMLKEFNQAIIDCLEGLKHEKQIGDLDKLRLRYLDALTNLGKLVEVQSYIQSHTEVINNASLSVSLKPFQEKYQSVKTILDNLELAKAALAKSEYSRSKRLLQQIQQAGVSSDIQVLILLAKAHLGLKELDDAGRISQQAISLGGKKGGITCLEAYSIRGEALASQGLTESACKYFTAALQLDPDNNSIGQRLKFLRKVLSDTVSIRKRIGDAMGEKKFDEALSACSDGLCIDKNCTKLMAEMHYKRAQAYHIIGKSLMHVNSADSPDSPCLLNYSKCLKDANSSLYYDKSMIESFYLKIEILQALKRHEEAVNELENKLSERDMKHNEELKEKFKTAKLLLKRSKRKDLYSILSIPNGSQATEADIKKAYKKSALKWHPDRHSASADAVKKEAEVKFKEISAAFELLTDPRKRKLYDQGYDPEDIDEKIEMERQYQEQGYGGRSRGHGHGSFGHY